MLDFFCLIESAKTKETADSDGAGYKKADDVVHADNRLTKGKGDHCNGTIVHTAENGDAEKIYAVSDDDITTKAPNSIDTSEKSDQTSQFIFFQYFV